MSDETKYQYTAAVLHVHGHTEPVGVADSEDEYPDAKNRALGEYHAWVRDCDLMNNPPDVVFMRRPISVWEVIDGD